MVAEWYYAKDKQVYGPLEAAELKRLATTGALGPNDLIRKASMKQWVRASSAKQLFPSSPPLTASDSSSSAVRSVAGTAGRSIPVFESESQLPQNVVGLSLEAVQLYPDPDLGVSFRYGTISTAMADVYMYTCGESHITEDLRSDQVVHRFQESVAGVIQTAKQGDYLDFEVLGQEYVHLPPNADNPFCMWASFAYSQAPGPGIFYTGRRVSHMAFRVERGYYNKVRYTNFIDSDAIAYVKLMQFFCAWTDLVQSGPVNRH